MKRRTSGENEDAPIMTSGRKRISCRPFSHTRILSKRFVFALQGKRQAFRIKVRRESAGSACGQGDAGRARSARPLI